MYICVCNAVTDREIRAARERGVSTLPELSASTGAASCCGSCSGHAHEILTGEPSCSRADCCGGPLAA